ncbi:MAG TPA: hypothetical protein VIY99_16090 [Terracidiphilus sp.]
MRLRGKALRRWLLCVAAGTCALAPGQDAASGARVDAHLRIEFSAQNGRSHRPPAVVWLKPPADDRPWEPPANAHYTLLQKNRMFTPHLLVVPVGSVVHFPNADPFFHNVFSLFNGKRFDLGLYEAGTTKEETFSREGVSYIFCNIHPEMSAVIVALSTPYYGVADASGAVRIHDVPAGTYEMHVWVEGLTQQALTGLTRRVEVGAGGDLGVVEASSVPRKSAGHLNKFGEPYGRDTKTY